MSSDTVPTQINEMDSSGGLSGGKLVLAGFLLAISNFIVVLDTTIANVSVPHIAGGVGVSVSEATWVVTSYSVAEAICVPLTGWLVLRYGAVRTFLAALIGFGCFSFLCGLSGSLSTLVIFRLGQGFAGGPLMPLTQTLLILIFPKEKQPAAMALWAMTTITAPIIGPIAGGWISDNWSWEWIFFINIPIVIGCALGVMTVLRDVKTPTERLPIDKIGIFLLVVWVGALQLMLDTGRDHDWFGSGFIVGCAIVAAIGFCAFLIWVLTERHPIVDLSVFRHRGFTVSVIALTCAFGTYFASIVIIPQWLQTSLGYTATQAGHVLALNGVLALMMAPFVPKLMKIIDPRFLVFFGVAWLGVACLMRTGWTSDATFFTIALPQLVQGLGMPLFFVPITVICLGAVTPKETASAAGIMNFGRTLSAAFGTAIVATVWSNSIRSDTNSIVNTLNDPQQLISTLEQSGFSSGQALGALNNLVTAESTALATSHLFAMAAVVFFLSAIIIWFSPRPPKDVDTSQAH